MSSSAHLEVRFPEAQLPGSAYPPSGVSSEDPSSAAAAHAPQAEAAILLASLTKEQRAVLAKLDKVREREREGAGGLARLCWPCRVHLFTSFCASFLGPF